MTRLKKRIETNVLATLKEFKVTDSEFIPFSKSRTDTSTWSSRYQKLKRDGLITGEFRFHRSNEPRGTTIVRIK